MRRLDPSREAKLVAFARSLVDQTRAQVVIHPQRPAAGFWFGGGNLVEVGNHDLFLVGRYRNQGDSRTGVAAGERGCELAIFRSAYRGGPWEKVLSFSKSDLDLPDRAVLSIEGSALYFSEDSVELLVSTERQGIGYPSAVAPYLKPGCGVWTIERLAARDIPSLAHAPVETIFRSDDPEHLHVKDPRVYRNAEGELLLMFCTHPYCWSSSNTAFAHRASPSESFVAPQFGLFPRGTTWDVAITRGTCLLDVPQVGAFRERRVTLLFYDGGECVRDLEPHPTSVHRPRGYSCEELGGLAYFLDGDCSRIFRLSATGPIFVSPHATGCSRYVDVLAAHGKYYATWQQAQPDRSQPLVMHIVDAEEAAGLLS